VTGPALALLASTALVLGCSTRVVDLLPRAADGAPGTDADNVGPDGGTADASEIVKCEPIVRDDGSVCRVCYAADGSIRGGNCDPPKPDAGQMVPVPPGNPMNPIMVPPPPADAAVVPSKCTVIPDKQPRCLNCDRAGMLYTTCLRCDAPIPTGLGDSCQVCVWSDLPNSRCLQCFEPMSNKTTHDDCDSLRTELLSR
jgi:hypothetical protein